MIEMQYNWPLIAGQAAQWQQHLRTAVDQLPSDDLALLRPTFRMDLSSMRAVAASWIGSSAETTWITAGGHHGSLLAMMAARLAGKTIAVDGITYTGILRQAEMLGCALAAVDFDAEGMTAESLQTVCRQQKIAAIYTMPSVHNPLGCTAGLARREAIAAVARQFDLVIIQDDAYGYMEPAAPANYFTLAPERTFYVRGLSKSYAPATRTGFLVVPPGHDSAMATAMMNSATGTSLVHNMAAIALIADGSLQQVIDHKLTEGARRNAASRAVLGPAAAPGAASAWHIWVTLPDTLEAAEAERLIAERGALVSSGHWFALPGVQARGLRMALGGETEFERMMEGVRMVGEVVRKQHCA